jgi:hypothetical protein
VSDAKPYTTQDMKDIFPTGHVGGGFSYPRIIATVESL